MSRQQNSDDDDDDDSESMSTQNIQPISLTSFVNTTTDDHNIGGNLSLRQTRQRMNTNENNGRWQMRTRYSTRSTASNRSQDDDYDHRSEQKYSLAHMLSASDDDYNIASNSKRNRIERSDRRISSINRPNYKIDSDEHEEDDDDNDLQGPAEINTMNINKEDTERMEKGQNKLKGRNSLNLR